MLIHIVASCQKPAIQGERLFKKLKPLMMSENPHAHSVQAYNYVVSYVNTIASYFFVLSFSCLAQICPAR